jgi:hypothetical protein
MVPDVCAWVVTEVHLQKVEGGPYREGGDQCVTPPRDPRPDVVGMLGLSGVSSCIEMRVSHLLCMFRCSGFVSRSAGFSIPVMW